MGTNPQVVLTTKRMITTAIDQRRYNAPYHQADATYKLTLEGHPILMTGGANWERQFLATAVMMSSKQKDDDFAVIEDTVRFQMHLRRGQVGRPRKRAPALERQADELGLASHLPPPQHVRRLDGQETPGTLPVAPPRRSTRSRNAPVIPDM